MPTKVIAQRVSMRLAAMLVAFFVLFGAALVQASPGAVASIDSSFDQTSGLEQDIVPLQRCISLNEAINRAKRQGRVISAETRGNRHVVKVLTSDNRVKTLTFPACG